MTAQPTPSSSQATTSLISLLRTRGQGDYIGESISQLAHSLQCAHLAASNNPDDHEIIIAGLLHDIGQFLPAAEIRAVACDVRDMRTTKTPTTTTTNRDASGGDTVSASGSVGRIGHETTGATYLSTLNFSPKVCALVGSHVAAKRYLCATDAAYHDTLSEASKQSLVFQGGPMSESEVREWDGGQWAGEMARLRKWDDRAKVLGLDVPGLEAYEEMIRGHLEGRVVKL